MPTFRSLQTLPPGRPGSRTRRPRAQAGFTLIEVLVSALMVALLAGAAAKALIATNDFSADQRYRSQADSIASQDQDRVRSFSDEQLNQLQNQSQSRTENVNGTVFTVTSAASYLSTTGSSGCSTSAAAYYKVSSTVAWSEGFSRQNTSLTDSSVLARPVAGDLVVQVTDQTGTDMSGIPIQASGPSTQSETTNSDGCVVFAGLTPGAYTVTATDQGYVSPPNATSYATPSPLTASATVNATTPATVNFQMGQAGSIAATLSANGTPSNGSTVTVPGEADGLSWIGDSASKGGMTQPATAPTTAAIVTAPSASPLYPFDMSTTSPASYTNNYAVWAGRCSGQEPPSPTQASVAPGSLNQAVAVSEPLLYMGNVTLSGFSGVSSAKPADVELTYSQSSPSCTDKWFAAVASGTTIPATGWLQYPGQPYAASGTLTVCADYKSGSSYYDGTTTTASNTSFAASNTANTVPAITITKTTRASGKCS